MQRYFERELFFAHSIAAKSEVRCCIDRKVNRSRGPGTEYVRDKTLMTRELCLSPQWKGLHEVKVIDGLTSRFRGQI